MTRTPTLTPDERAERNRERCREYSRTHREQINARNRERYRELYGSSWYFRKKKAANNEKWRAAHRDHVREYQHEYYLKRKAEKGMGIFDGTMGEAWEATPTTREFPSGVPEYVDTDTRLYWTVSAAKIGETSYEYIITRYDRESDTTTAYFTAHMWDFAKHGPQVESLSKCNGRAAHRRVMKRAGYIVKTRARGAR